ncbi:MAG: hypothetical protein H0U69_14440 [Trueperaceae bacterium]|nr:hypothetical protein [Trueperaceae bacterium]
MALLLVSTATAQMDERARELLEGAQLEVESVEYRTMEQTMTMIWYEPDGTVVSETTTHIAIDFEDRRVAMSTFADDELVSKTMYVDGESTLFTPDTGAIPAPPMLAAIFDLMLDEPAQDSWGDATVASYDGFHSYAGIVSGEQVTVMGVDVPVPGLDMATDMRVLFDDAGRIAAVVVGTAEAGTVLMVFDTPIPALPLSLQSVTTYMLEGEEAVLTSRTIFEEVRLNEPLDERLFDLEVGGR